MSRQEYHLRRKRKRARTLGNDAPRTAMLLGAGMIGCAMYTGLGAVLDALNGGITLGGLHTLAITLLTSAAAGALGWQLIGSGVKRLLQLAVLHAKMKRVRRRR